MANETASSGGIGFLGLLTVLFIGLKLTNYIAWPWYWVLAPMWVPLAIIALVVAVIGVFAIWAKMS